MKNMACVSLSATHPGTSRKHDTRDLYSPQPPRVSFRTSFHCKFGTLNRRKKTSGSYMTEESLIVKKEKPENLYYFHT